MKEIVEQNDGVKYEDQKNLAETTISTIDARKALSRPIALHPIFIDISGSVTAGLMFSQIWYWWGRMNYQEFYKSNQELRKETRLSDMEIRRAKKILIKSGLISVVKKGIPCTTFYTVNEARFWELVALQPAETSVALKQPNLLVQNTPTNSETTHRLLTPPFQKFENSNSRKGGNNTPIVNNFQKADNSHINSQDTPAEHLDPKDLSSNKGGHPPNPPKATKKKFKPTKQLKAKAGDLAGRRIRSLHWPGRRVKFVKDAAFGYCLKCLQNGEDEENIVRSYSLSLEEEHVIGTDQKRIREPSGTISRAYKRLELQPKSQENKTLTS